jgi:hypothetical protein
MVPGLVAMGVNPGIDHLGTCSITGFTTLGGQRCAAWRAHLVPMMLNLAKGSHVLLAET